MRAVSFLGRGTRHVVGVGLQALLLVAIVGIIALTMSAVYKPAGFIAGVDDARAGRSSGSSSIDLASVSGRSASIQPTLGSSVEFATTYPSNTKNPRIEVLCYQDGSLVYGEAGGVNDAYLLGGGGSLWKDKGGAADCRANLYYFGWKAGKQTYNRLATTTFSAGG
jgi:hypothetical protein